MTNQPIDIVISFDTTGSMYPCLAEVRRKVDDTATRLFKEVPNLRIGIIAHGDYCDARTTYVTKHLPLTTDIYKVSQFIKSVSATGGGDAPECYELVLREANTMQPWTAGSKRVLVMIGDDVPHEAAHNPGRINWRDELKSLTNNGILVHGVQALNRRGADNFYRQIAETTGGFHLPLSQFTEATEMLLAVVYQQVSPERLQAYETEVQEAGRMSRGLDTIFQRLARRDAKTGRFQKTDARAVEASRFQQIFVEDDMPIKDLVTSNGLVFKVGRASTSSQRLRRFRTTRRLSSSTILQVTCSRAAPPVTSSA
jgi:hypothetical protein